MAEHRLRRRTGIGQADGAAGRRPRGQVHRPHLRDRLYQRTSRRLTLAEHALDLRYHACRTTSPRRAGATAGPTTACSISTPTSTGPGPMTDQTKIAGTPQRDHRRRRRQAQVRIDTIGFDINNTSRFELGLGPPRAHLRRRLRSRTGSTSSTRPAPAICSRRTGERTVSGGFAQLKVELSRPGSKSSSPSRYDTYKLDGGGVHTAAATASRPRSPSASRRCRLHRLRDLRGGLSRAGRDRDADRGHAPRCLPRRTSASCPIRRCGRRSARTRRSASICATTTSSPRATRSAPSSTDYRNDLTDFIELTVVASARRLCVSRPSPFCFQYQNIPSARIEGWRVREPTTTPAPGSWGSPAATSAAATSSPAFRSLKIPPDQIATTFGCALPRPQADRRRCAGSAVNAKLAQDIPNSAAITGNPDLPPTSSYNLVNLYAGYQLTPDVTCGAVGRKPVQCAIRSLSERLRERQQRVAVPEPRHHRQGLAGGAPGRTGHAVESCAHDKVMRQANQLAELAVSNPRRRC